MGVSWRQGRSRRAARRDADPRAGRGTRYRGERALSRALHLRIPFLFRFPSPDAALPVPALGGDGECARGANTQMAASESIEQPCDAAGGHSPYTDAARSVLNSFLR